VWADGTVAVLESNRPDGTGPDYDLYLSQRDSTDVPWPVPALLGVAPLVSNGLDAHPVLSPDLLTLYFYSSRDGTNDLFVARRASPIAPFDAPVPIAELNTPDFESAPWVSPDGRDIYFIRADAQTSSVLMHARR
jgi:hypothetical protein